MTKDEWKNLTDSLAGALSAGSSGSALPSVTQVNRGKSPQSDIETIAQTEASAQQSAYDRELLNQRPPKQSSSGSQSSGGGFAPGDQPQGPRAAMSRAVHAAAQSTAHGARCDTRGGRRALTAFRRAAIGGDTMSARAVRTRGRMAYFTP